MRRSFRRSSVTGSFKNDIGIRLRLTCLVSQINPVTDRVPGCIEKTPAAMNVAPALKNQPLGIVTHEKELRKSLIGNLGNVFRARNMRLTRPAKLQFGTVIFAIRTTNNQHGLVLKP